MWIHGVDINYFYYKKLKYVQNMFISCPYFLYKHKVKVHYKLNTKQITKPIKFGLIALT